MKFEGWYFCSGKHLLLIRGDQEHQLGINIVHSLMQFKFYMYMLPHVYDKGELKPHALLILILIKAFQSQAQAIQSKWLIN